MPGGVGERRHVTVMFCDLADLTGIAVKLARETRRFPRCRVKLNFDVGVGLSFAA